MTFLEIVFWTLALFPVYLSLRWPFLNLPLHLDTGFYVSNHTVCTRQISFAKGWNARFAGCGKVLPEFFYSRVYLAHGGRSYKRVSRLYYSIVNYGTAVLVGILAWRLLGDVRGFLFGLIAYASLSSEPSWGGYFESGEQFELPLQTGAAILVFEGVSRGSGLLVGSGALLWALSAFFVKLSSLASWGALMTGIALFDPRSVPWSTAALLIAAAIWTAWVRWQGFTVSQLIRTLRAHEAFYVQTERGGWATFLLQRLRERAELMGAIIKKQPLLPLMAVLGLIAGPRRFVALYLAAVSIAYLAHAGRVWYYGLPLLPGLAAAAAAGGLWILARNESIGYLALAFISVLWVAQHAWHWHRRLWSGDLDMLNRAVWHLYPSRFPDRNATLERFADRIRHEVDGASMLTFGLWSQSYVLVGASYDTPFLTAAAWLDTMAPDWSATLNQRIWNDPPSFILDTGWVVDESCLDPDALAQLALRYSIAAEDIGFRLFRLNGRAGVAPCMDVRLFCPESMRVRSEAS